MPVIELKILSPIEIIFRLFNDRLDQFILLANHMSLGNILSSPLTCPPIMGIPFTDYPIECSACFFHRSIIVGSMTKNNIHIVESHFSEGCLGSFYYMLSRKSNGIR